MRLICPNCGAQYEVADDVIPQDGRDVQCSNCAHTWFEDRTDTDVAEDTADDSAAAPTQPDADEDSTPQPQWGADDYAPKPVMPKPVVPEKPTRQELAPAIADILREEAARETASRRAEAEAVESQPDLGLDSANAAPDQRSVEAQRRMASRKGEAMPTPATVPSRAAIAAASRGDLLPDIEEINSSLRSDVERGTGYAEFETVADTRKRGVRTGFIGNLCILAILTAVYIFAAEIREIIPVLDDPLTAYVDTIDNGRLWLDAQLRNALDAMTSQDTVSGPDTGIAGDAAAPAVTTQAPEMTPVTE